MLKKLFQAFDVAGFKRVLWLALPPFLFMSVLGYVLGQKQLTTSAILVDVALVTSLLFIIVGMFLIIAHIEVKRNKK